MQLALLIFITVWLLTPASSAHLLARLGAVSASADAKAQLAASPPSSSRVSRRSRSVVDDPLRRAVFCASAFAMLGWTTAGPLMAAVAVPGGLLVSWWMGRLESPGSARAREEVARDMPLAADLLGACAFVGRPVDESLEVVARAVGGVLASRVETITARLALGADPATEWRTLAADPQLAPLARTLARTSESGAPLVEGLARLADDCRRERRTHTQLRARNVGVKAAGPLAACFLPAFMLIGVVPTIAGAFVNLVL